MAIEHDARCSGGWIPIVDEGGDERLAPCPDCRPALFIRWAGGHLAEDHDRLACPECQQRVSSAPRARWGRRGRRPVSDEDPGPQEPPTDLWDGRSDLH